MTLNKLSKKQEEALKSVRNKYLDDVFKYNIFNEVTFDSIRRQTCELYEQCGLKKPIVIFLDSPLAIQVAANMLKNRAQVRAQVWDQVGAQVGAQVRDQVGDQVWDQVWAQVGDQVRAQVWDQVGAQVRAQVWAQVGAQVRDQVRAQVWDQVGAQVRDQVWDQVGAQVRDQVGAQVRAQVGAQVRDQVGAQECFNLSSYGNSSDLGFFSFIDFFLNHTDIKIQNKFLESTMKVCRDTFMSIQLDGLCLVSRYPSYISRDNQNNLHNTKKAAIEFADGYKIFYVNGRIVSEDIVNEKFNFEDFLNEENEDIKASMITVIKENRGNKGLLDFLGAECVDEKQLVHGSGHIETLRLFKTKQSFSFLQDRNGNMNQPYCWSGMKCPSTGSTYLIDNSADFTCAIEAVKFLRPDFVSMELEYNFSEFNN